MEIRRYARITFVVLAAALWLTLGYTVNGSAQEANPCSADLNKFCKDVKAGEGRIAACLENNQTQLSPACKNHLDKVTKEAKKMGGDCYDDIMLFCPVTKPGQGRIIACLEAKRLQGTNPPYGQLTSSCANWLLQRKKEATQK